MNFEYELEVELKFLFTMHQIADATTQIDTFQNTEFTESDTSTVNMLCSELRGSYKSRFDILYTVRLYKANY